MLSVTSAMSDSEDTAQLETYLLSSRGWILLYAIHIIGLEVWIHRLFIIFSAICIIELEESYSFYKHIFYQKQLFHPCTELYCLAATRGLVQPLNYDPLLYDPSFIGTHFLSAILFVVFYYIYKMIASFPTSLYRDL
jgi:hypothetical protein